jgi:hypothetical protein
VFVYAGRVIRVRGVPISDDNARELARRLGSDPVARDFVERLERALTMDGGLIGTHRLEAQAVLVAIDGMLDRSPSERLLELRASLVEMVDL